MRQNLSGLLQDIKIGMKETIGDEVILSAPYYQCGKGYSGCFFSYRFIQHASNGSGIGMGISGKVWAFGQCQALFDNPSKAYGIKVRKI